MTYGGTGPGGGGVPEGYGASAGPFFVNGRSAQVGSVGAPAKKIINGIIQANQ